MTKQTAQLKTVVPSYCLFAIQLARCSSISALRRTSRHGWHASLPAGPQGHETPTRAPRGGLLSTPSQPAHPEAVPRLQWPARDSWPRQAAGGSTTAHSALGRQAAASNPAPHHQIRNQPRWVPRDPGAGPAQAGAAAPTAWHLPPPLLRARCAGI